MKLEVDRVTKKYKDNVAVDNFCYTFNKGIYGLLGPNGSGKTTLLRIICGILNQSSGDIYYRGTNICKLVGEYQKEIGYLPQKFPYYPEFTCYDFLMYMAVINDIPAEKTKVIVNNLLEEVGLLGRKNEKIRNCSGGMKQRLGIAQTLLTDPSILVLDEPTSGLDPKERVRFRNLIHRLSSNRIVIISTHIVSDVEYIANEVLIMKNGKKLLHGDVRGVVNSIMGKVWEGIVSADELNYYLTDYNIASLVESEYGTRIRIVSNEKPQGNFNCVEPNLEDVYLYHFEERK